MAKPSGVNSGPEGDFEKKFRLLGNLPSELVYPPDGEKAVLKKRAEDNLTAASDLIVFLDEQVKRNLAINDALKKELEDAKKENRAPAVPQGKGPLEELNPDPEPADLNMQLALTRLVADADEQELARLKGKEFQTKYNLTNNQMFTLCRLAVQIGFYKDTADLRRTSTSIRR